MPRSVLSFIVALLLTLSGCAVNPVTGERQLSLVSTEQEIAIGSEQYQTAIQQQGGEYLAHPEVGRYVSEVGQRLAAASHNAALPFEFVVINSDVPNAWALPGGKIAINRGLLQLLEDEAQLAAVLGHEIVHVTARHGAQGMSRGILVELSAGIAGVAAGEAGDLVASGVRTGGGMLVAKYSRDQELEADLYGTRYMSQVGYDPDASAELQAILMKLAEGSEPDLVTSLFASHPPSYQRLEINRETARKLPGDQRNKSRFQQQLKGLKASQPAYRNYQQGLALLEKDPGQALQLATKALSIEPREGLFQELRGDALSLLKQDKAAIEAYSKAIELNPGYFSHRLARGLAYFSQQKFSLAATDLKEGNDRLPTRTGVFYAGETALQLGDLAAARQHYQAVATGDDKIAQIAQQRLQSISQQQAP